MLAHIDAVRSYFANVAVFLSQNGPLVEMLQERDIPCHVVPFVHRGLRKRLPMSSFWKDLRSVAASRRAYLRNLQHFLSGHSSLVHVHSSVCIYAMWAAARSGTPLVVHVRETRRPTVESWFREQCMLRWADRIITVSNGIQRGYSERFRRKAVTIYNWVAVPERPSPPREDRRIIAFVGSVHFEKGIREFLEMCARLKIQDEPFEAHIYGHPLNNVVAEWCHDFVARHELTSRVCWCGVRQKAEEIYPHIDLVVLPTYFDALPRSVMEAMAWGVPVVASRVGGLPEMLGNDEAGCLVPPRDVEAMTLTVQRLLRNPERRQKLAYAARNRAQALFSRERYVKHIMDVYDEVCAHDRISGKTA